jgi:MFS family permease
MREREKGMQSRNILSFRIVLPPLLLDKAFRRYWGATVTSQGGDSLSELAIPLTAAIVLHVSAAQISILSALVWLPSLLFAVPAGQWADAIGRRRIMMISANLVAFTAMASIPVCFALHLLSLWQLYIVIFVGGLCSVFFNVCDATLFVSLVPRARYVEGQTLIFGSAATATLVGPSLGGLLVQAISAPYAILVDAGSFLCSAFLLSRIRPVEPPVKRDGSERKLMAGFRFMAENSKMRATLAVAAGVNLFNAIFYAMFVLYMVRDLNVNSGLIGSLLAATATGAAVGSLATGWVVRQVNEGWALLIGSVMISAPLAVVPMTKSITATSLTLLFLALLSSGVGRVIQNITIGSIFAVLVPDILRARTRGAFQTVSFGGRLLGSLFGGILGTALGLRSALSIAAVGGALMFVWLLPSDLLRSRAIEQESQTLSAKTEQ